MTIDALLPGVKDPASLKFASFFNGFTYGATTRIATRLCKKTVTGTDITGFRAVEDIQAFFGSGATLELQLLVEDTATLPASDGMAAPLVDNHLLVSTVSPSALVSNPQCNDIKFDVLTKASAVGTYTDRPQIWWTITRTSYSTQGDIEEVYYAFVTKLPANLATLLDYANGSNFHVVFDKKTGGYLNQGVGDKRFLCTILADASGMRWQVKMDNRANGNWNGSTSTSDPRVGTAGNFWQVLNPYGTAIDLDTPLLMEIYLKMPPKINTLSSTIDTGARDPRYEYDNDNGICLVGVTNLNTGVHTNLCNQRGGRFYGASNRDWDRIFTGLYNVGAAPFSVPLSKWVVYDTIPAHSRLRELL